MASVSPMAVSPMASDADAQGTAADDTSVRLQEGVTDAQDAALVAHRHEFNAQLAQYLSNERKGGGGTNFTLLTEERYMQIKDAVTASAEAVPPPDLKSKWRYACVGLGSKYACTQSILPHKRQSSPSFQPSP